MQPRFPSAAGLFDFKPLKDFRSAWEGAFNGVGLEPRLFQLHDFKRDGNREYANMVRAGISELVAMRISGYKTRSVFDRYNIINEDDLVRASEKMSSMLQDKENAVLAQTGIVGTVGNLRVVK
jgi:hypothetical protein